MLSSDGGAISYIVVKVGDHSFAVCYRGVYIKDAEKYFIEKEKDTERVKKEIDQRLMEQVD